MKIFIAALICKIRALLVDPAQHTQITWTTEEVPQPYREYDITPMNVFGDKKFSKIFVNGYGSVSFDMYQLAIIDSQTFTEANLHKIIIAPWWAAVSTPIVKVEPNGIGTDDAVVNNWISSQTEISFTATTLFTVTWIDQTTTASPSDPKTFQVVLASDGYFSFAIFSYENGQPTWTADDDGMTPISGILTHHRRSYLCLKTELTTDKDFSSGNEMAWNLHDDLDCTNTESFTECGDVVEADRGSSDLAAMNLQYSYTLHYKSTTVTQYSAFNWQFYASVTCYDGFQLDSAGNNNYKRECIYDSDFYESEWLNPTDDQTGGALQCREMIPQNVQINIISITIETFPSDFLWMLNMNPNDLNANDMQIWIMLFRYVFTDLISNEYGLQITVHITNIDANDVARRRRNAQLIQTLVNDGLVDPSLIANIANLKSYLLTQAENAGTLSTTGQVNHVDFVVGFDLTDVTTDEVKDAIITVLNNIQLEPITNSTEIPTAIVTQIPTQIQEVIDATSCLNKGQRPTNPNPHWIKPDTCCGGRPYNRNYVGCCYLVNGHKQVFDIANDRCCHGTGDHMGTIMKDSLIKTNGTINYDSICDS